MESIVSSIVLVGVILFLMGVIVYLLKHMSTMQDKLMARTFTEFTNSKVLMNQSRKPKPEKTVHKIQI